jgi:hypothetical protein
MRNGSVPLASRRGGQERRRKEERERELVTEWCVISLWRSVHVCMTLYHNLGYIHE